MLLGVGGTIGTGIFVLTSEAAQKAGPGMLFSFILAGTVCGFAALCYAELAAMVPRAGSAYTYVSAAMGEVPGWMVGWALLMEYAVTAAAVAVGWSGYLSGELQAVFHRGLPTYLQGGLFTGGLINLPAVLALAVTGLLMLGTEESARINSLLVVVKLSALGSFAFFALRGLKVTNFHPFAPMGWTSHGGSGVLGAAASIFFAYVGFDAVSTAAEETRNPQRNVPLGLIGGLAVCIVVYLIVAIGVIGSPLGAQPVFGGGGRWLAPGSRELTKRCSSLMQTSLPLPCSNDGLAHVMRSMGHHHVAGLIGLAAFLALPSVVLVLIYGQTRMLFAMSRDGILPASFGAIHPRWRTPSRMTALTGVAVAFAAAFLPIGKLADIANSGTLFAFSMIAIAVLRLRKIAPEQRRPFRAPAIQLLATCTILGCLGLFASLPRDAQLVLPVWSAVGLTLYCLILRSRAEIAG